MCIIVCLFEVNRDILWKLRYTAFDSFEPLHFSTRVHVAVVFCLVCNVYVAVLFLLTLALPPHPVCFCLFQNNYLVFMAELFWWFEVVKPSFVQPRVLDTEGKQFFVLQNCFVFLQTSDIQIKSFLFYLMVLKAQYSQNILFPTVLYHILQQLMKHLL